MSENIYDILNDMDINLEELSKEGFNEIEKKQIKNRFSKSNNKNKKRNKKKSIVAATIASAIIVVVLGSGVGTYAASAIRLASLDIASFLGNDKDLDKYKTVVGKTISNDGVSIQLNEVILNGNELVVSTTIKYEKGEFKTESIHSFGQVFINGKKMSEAAGGTDKITDDSAFQELMTYSLKESHFKGDLAIKIVYSSVLINGEVIKIKPCIFEFTTNGDELAIDTEEFPIKHSFTLENGSIVTLNNYVSNVIDKKIFLTIENIKKSKIVYDIKLEGYDDLGNTIRFETINMSKEKGMLKLSTVIGEEISKEATKITLVPYAVAYPKKSGRLNNDYKQVGGKFTIEIK